MIHFDLSMEPQGFNETVRQPGLDDLRELRGQPRLMPRPGPKREVPSVLTAKHLPNHWTRCLDDLAAAFKNVCAYSSFHVQPVLTGSRTVDHFAPKSDTASFELAYEWSNFRYACTTMNARKGTAKVCDPFAITDEWFVLSIVDYVLDASPALNPVEQVLVRETIDRLQLNSDRNCVKRRRLTAERYLGSPSARSFTDVRAECPLVAKELVRQGLVASEHLPGDTSVPPGSRWRQDW